jgi:hypothetical protein
VFGCGQSLYVNEQLYLSLTHEIYRPITEQELAVVPYLGLGFWLFYMGFHTTHDQFYVFTQPSHLKLTTGWLRKMVETYWDNDDV